jgi:hypothetical protein
MLVSFKCENVSSVASAMAQTQHQDNVSVLLLFINSIKFSEKKSEVKCFYCAVGVDKSFMISLSMYNHNEKGSGSALQLQLHDLILYVLFCQSCIAANSVGLYPKPS